MSGVTLDRFSPGAIFDAPQSAADEPQSGRTVRTAVPDEDAAAKDSASAMGRTLDSQLGSGTQVATLTLDGSFMLGVDFLRGIGPGEFGYLAVDLISAGQTAAKFFQNTKLAPTDEVPIRLHVEAGLRGIANIPGIGPALAEKIAEKYPKLQQGQIGAAADIVVSGRRDGKPGVEIKKFELVGYVNVPPPPGEVRIHNGTVSPGGLDKNLSNISFGINYSAGKGWSWVPPALLHGKITNLAIPPQATPVNGDKFFFDGFALIGFTPPNDDGAMAGRTLLSNVVSGASATGDSRLSQLASGAGYAANATVFVDAMGGALLGRKKIVNGEPEKQVGVGLVAGVFKKPGVRVPGEPALFVRGLMTATAEQDGKQTVHVKYAGKPLFTTSLPQIQAAGKQVVDAFEKLPGVSFIVKPRPAPQPSVYGSLVDQKALDAQRVAQQSEAARALRDSVGEIAVQTPPIQRVDVTLNGKTYANVPALPGASVQMPGQAAISVSDFQRNILQGKYSGSRGETNNAYQLTQRLPPGPQTDRLRAKLMTDYMDGSTKTVRGIIEGVLSGKPMTRAQAVTLIDVDNLLRFTNQVRAAAGVQPMSIPNLSAWADYARTGKLPAAR